MLTKNSVSRLLHTTLANHNTPKKISRTTSPPFLRTPLSTTPNPKNFPTERAKLREATRVLLATLSQPLPHTELFQAGIEALMELIQVKNGAIGILNNQGELTQFVCGGMNIEESRKIHLFSANSFNSSGANARKNPAPPINICSEKSQDARPLGHAHSLLLVPISISDRVYGWICLCGKHDQSAFNDEDQELTLSLANAFALMMDNARKMEALEQEQRHLTHTALHDSLTKLPNRTLLYDRLIQALNHANRNHTRLTLLFCDLDGFKSINDTLGHQAGDHVLRTIAERFVNGIRVNDTVARIGGDEFIFVLSELESDEQAAAIAQKILDTISQPITFANHDIVLFGSIGIAIYPFDGKETESLMKTADEAMYTSKKRGKNNYFFARELQT